MSGYFECIFLNGTVGSGKSTISDAISKIEPARHAVIDLDQIRRLVPGDPDDYFNQDLELKNLASMVQNYRQAGARRFIIAGVIERSDDLPRYASALGSTGVFVCRLTATAAELDRRLRTRHSDDRGELVWHLVRAEELTRILDDDPFEALAVDTTHSSPLELAQIVRDAAGWTNGGDGQSARSVTVKTWQTIDSTMDNVRAVASIDDPIRALRASEVRQQGWLQVAGRAADGEQLPWPALTETRSVLLRDEQWLFISESLDAAVPIYRLIGNENAEADAIEALADITLVG